MDTLSRRSMEASCITFVISKATSQHFAFVVFDSVFVVRHRRTSMFVGHLELFVVQILRLRQTHPAPTGTSRPGQILLTGMQGDAARRMELDVAAFDLQVGPLGRGQQVALGAGVQAGTGAGDGHFLVRRGRGLAALALQADLAAGGVQVQAGFGVGLAAVAGLADREQGQPVLDRQGVVALGDEVDVLAGAEAEVGAAWRGWHRPG